MRYRVVRLGDVCLRRRIAVWPITVWRFEVNMRNARLNDGRMSAGGLVWATAREWADGSVRSVTLGSRSPKCWGIIDTRDGFQ